MLYSKKSVLYYATVLLLMLAPACQCKKDTFSVFPSGEIVYYAEYHYDVNNIRSFTYISYNITADNPVSAILYTHNAQTQTFAGLNMVISYSYKTVQL